MIDLVIWLCGWLVGLSCGVTFWQLYSERVRAGRGSGPVEVTRPSAEVLPAVRRSTDPRAAEPTSYMHGLGCSYYDCTVCYGIRVH